MNTLLPATVRHAAVSFLAVVLGSSSTSMCAWHKQNPTTLTGVWSIGSLSDQQIQQEPKSMAATWQVYRSGESFKNKMDIFLSFLGCLFHPVLLYLIDPHVLPGTMPHRIHLHKAVEVKRMLINMIISGAEEQCGWMMSLKKLLNVLSVIYIYKETARVCATIWKTQQETTRNWMILYCTNLRLLCSCLANHLTCRLPSGQMLKDGRFMEAQTSLILLHIKHWPIYCADWQAGKQSVRALSLKQAAPISEITHGRVFQHHKSTLHLSFAWYWR